MYITLSTLYNSNLGHYEKQVFALIILIHKRMFKKTTYLRIIFCKSVKNYSTLSFLISWASVSNYVKEGVGDSQLSITM